MADFHSDYLSCRECGGPCVGLKDDMGRETFITCCFCGEEFVLLTKSNGETPLYQCKAGTFTRP